MADPCRFRVLTLAVVAVCSTAASINGAEPQRPSERQIATLVDAGFLQANKGKELPARTDDITYLRRVSLDLTGRLPDEAAMRHFEADPQADKRAQLVDRLLASEAFAVNWGRYWRDVVTYHTPSSANYLRWQLFDRWWTDQFKNNRPWNAIVAELVVSTGINDESAPVNYLTALYGNPIEIAATTSRVFLGVQIQCAQCHNAKNEPWKREQFHEFAAFFGRAKLIQHKDVDGRGTPYAIEGRSDVQYQMPDKRNATRMIDMEPRFLTGEAVSKDAPDEERRRALAYFITRPENPWFARSYINRMWTALFGWGFYPTVADLGSEEPPAYPHVLGLLEKSWVANGYDIRWLFRTMILTRAYQGQFQPSNVNGQSIAICPIRLRAEQVFEALHKALGFDENDKSIPSPAPNSAPAVQRHAGLRNMVYQNFKEDPSLPQHQVRGTIPQALMMMNSDLVHRYSAAQGKTLLADLFAQNLTDNQMVDRLYARVLARKPTSEEQMTCQRYVRRLGNRAEAMEDVLWSLLNSTEFLIKK